MARQARDNSRDRDSVKQEKRHGTRQLIVLLPVNNVSVSTISLSQMHRQEHQLTNLTVSTQCNTTQHN